MDSADRRTVVRLGSQVRFRDQDGEVEFRIVAPEDVDLPGGRMSVESPLGSALLGRRAGERVGLRTPGGRRIVLIVDVHDISE